MLFKAAVIGLVILIIGYRTELQAVWRKVVAYMRAVRRPLPKKQKKA